ncbi:hypothetical protein JCGZ_08388 [Jatropha curcas]|uniref:Uncharacterized protein n=1 Tax=Jatropha curcas TaxID=180498 RepID=A0A067KLU4_JATCU|nr:hypothetical protein JCGZ_08388 [Jatropha curcas]
MENRSHVLLNINELATKIRHKLEILHPLSDKCCIYRVPDRLRQLNDKAYTPRVVSIGPFHHAQKYLEAMEEHKFRYLQDFLQLSEINLEDSIKFIRENEDRLRNCYAENIKLNSYDFVKMILLDAIFVIMILLRFSFVELRNKSDRVYNKPWMIRDISFDLLLLENQIPFFVLEGLFMLSNILHVGEISILKLVYELFKNRWDLWVTDYILEIRNSSSNEIKHILDFIRKCQKPMELLQPHHQDIKMLVIPSITELYQAGVKFRASSSKNIFDIKSRNGILEIPRFGIGDRTESLLRNLQAFEQCNCLDNYVGDYIALMAKLVNGSKDVELLVENGIAENGLQGNEALAILFRKIDEENIIFPNKFYFLILIDELNVYCKTSWHKWKANLKQKYFNTPWAGVSVIGAVILLLLTVIQTVCSLLQV